MNSYAPQEVLNEIDRISAYLDFGYENLNKFEQSLKIELKESIERLRESENISLEVSDDEIILRCNIMDFEMLSTEELEQSHWLRTAGILDGFEFVHEYDNMFYATFIIMMYSCIERGLTKVCDISKDDQGQGVISQARSILRSKIGNKVENLAWKELKLIRWLRNTIVHSGMRFDLDYSQGDAAYDSIGYDALVEAKPELIEYLKLKNIYEKETGLILLNLYYCKYLVEFTRNFFLKISLHLREAQKNY